MANRLRTTISLDPEIHAIFKRMADISNVSVSRCMGDWLSDTSDAAEFIVNKLATDKQSSKDMFRNVHAVALALTKESVSGKEEGSTPVTTALAALERAALAPSSNTGLKSPRKAKAA